MPRNLLLPILLIALGIALLIGCIPIPATRQLQVDGRARPETAVGAGDKHPIHVGSTRIEDAYIELSQRIVTSHYSAGSDVNPHLMRLSYMRWQVSDDQTQFAAEYSIRTATWFYPLCFYASPSTARRWVVLTVDRDGIVQSAKSTDIAPGFDRFWPQRVVKVFDEKARRKIRDAGLLPDDATLQRMISISVQNRSATRPATR